MRVVNKKELLEMPPYILFRKCYHGMIESCTGEAEIKVGQDFGAIGLLPGFSLHEEVEETWDWDGKLDVEEDETFLVFEKADIELLQKRLELVMNECDFGKVAQIGCEASEFL